MTHTSTIIHVTVIVVEQLTIVIVRFRRVFIPFLLCTICGCVVQNLEIGLFELIQIVVMHAFSHNCVTWEVRQILLVGSRRIVAYGGVEVSLLARSSLSPIYFVTTVKSLWPLLRRIEVTIGSYLGMIAKRGTRLDLLGGICSARGFHIVQTLSFLEIFQIEGTTIRRAHLFQCLAVFLLKFPE